MIRLQPESRPFVQTPLIRLWLALAACAFTTLAVPNASAQLADNQTNGFGNNRLVTLKRIVNRGKLYLSNAELNGRFCLRACIVNHLTKDQDIDVVVPEILDAASEILSEHH